jgi:predicted MFS family arabinose efflux permease
MRDRTDTGSDQPSPDQDGAGRKRLPLGGLLVLSAAAFLTMLTETVPAGLLPQIGDGLDVSLAQAGQLLTVYAVGSMLAAIPLTALTRGLPRRPLLLATILTVGIVNLITTLSSSYEVTLVARLIAGMGAGVQWAMIAGYAMRMVGETDKGRALAVSMAGVPLALAFGVPIGTVLGNLVGWRFTFAAMAVLAIGMSAWTVRKLPAVPGEPAQDRIPVSGVLARRGLLAILITAFAFEVGHMNLYTYVAPFLDQAGLGSHVGAVLLVFGLAAVLGLWAAGALIDHHLRAVAIGSFAVFTGCMFAFGAASGVAAVVLVGVGLWGFALGGATTMLQAAAAKAAGPATDVAQSMLVTVLNAGMSAGAAVGGFALAGTGVDALPWISFAAFGAAFVLILSGRRHAFPAPPKAHADGVGQRSKRRTSADGSPAPSGS